MDEILKSLLESELLSEDVKAEISSKWTESVETFKQGVREEVTLEVRSELAEQWVRERDALLESVEKFVSENMGKEIEELKGDIERFRDLEAEFAEKLVEEKHTLAEQLAEELDGLVDKIDAFFEVRLAEELEELNEDLAIVKQNDFGRRIFEAFVSEFGRSYVDEDAVQSKLTVTESKLTDAEKRIAELEGEKAKMIREAKMEAILAPLTGRKREQMSFVLQNVETARLEEAYKHFIGRVLKEDDSKTTVTESATAPTVVTEGTVVVTGEEPAAAAAPAAPAKTTPDLTNLRRLAGIK